MHDEYLAQEYPDTVEPMTIEAMVRENTKKLDDLIEWSAEYVREQVRYGVDRLTAENAKTAGTVAKLASDLEGAENRRASRIEDTFNAFQKLATAERRELIERIKAVEKVIVSDDETAAKLADITRRVLVDDNRIINLGATVIRLESRIKEIGEVTQTHTRMFMGIMRGVEEAIPSDEEPDEPSPPPAEPPKPKPPDESCLATRDLLSLTNYEAFDGDNSKVFRDAVKALGTPRVCSWLKTAAIITGDQPGKSDSGPTYPVSLFRNVSKYLRGLWHPSQERLTRNGLINHILTSELASSETTGNGKA